MRPIECEKPEEADRRQYFETSLEPHHTHFVLQEGGMLADLRAECMCATTHIVSM